MMPPTYSFTASIAFSKFVALGDAELGYEERLLCVSDVGDCFVQHVHHVRRSMFFDLVFHHRHQRQFVQCLQVARGNYRFGVSPRYPIHIKNLLEVMSLDDSR